MPWCTSNLGYCGCNPLVVPCEAAKSLLRRELCVHGDCEQVDRTEVGHIVGRRCARELQEVLAPPAHMQVSDKAQPAGQWALVLPCALERQAAAAAVRAVYADGYGSGIFMLE